MKTNLKMNGGFTLVELIVVIAILAILAGVAVPAYSGYIQKAESAADTQLLSALNTAFNAACMENSIVVSDIKNAAIGVNQETGAITGLSRITMLDGTVYQVIAGRSASPVSIAAIKESFDRFFAGNENTAFKVIRALHFDPKLGMFVDKVNAEEVSFYYGSSLITIDGSALGAMSNSSFVNAGGAGLADSVHDLTGMVTGDYETINDMAEDLYGEEGMEAASELISKYTGMSLEQIYTPGENESDEEYQARLKSMLANSIVLEVANTSTTMDRETLTQYVNGGNMVGGTKGLAQAAMAYGMYTAFINSDKAPEGATADIESMKAALKDKNSAFNAYLKDEQAQTDMEAYIGALGAIGQNTDNTDMTSDVVINGFSSEQNAELADLMNQLLGN